MEVRRARVCRCGGRNRGSWYNPQLWVRALLARKGCGEEDRGRGDPGYGSESHCRIFQRHEQVNKALISYIVLKSTSSLKQLLSRNSIPVYARNMVQRFRNAVVVGAGAWMLAGCQTASQRAGAPTPEAKQVISDRIKRLYMDVSTSPPQSAGQQKLILRMAERASNAKELLLVRRAADGVFSAGGAAETDIEKQVRSTVTGKMIRCATLGQLLNYAAGYPADAADTRALVARLFDLGRETPGVRVWYRIRVAAFHLRQKDLAQQAEARGDALSAR